MIAGNQHWGHATSTDLYTWKNQPIALSPDGGEIFSGSIVIDEDNTSGLFTNVIFPSGVKYGLVAIYTRNTPEKQTQWIASSTDGGYTWAGYAHNPVIDSNSNHFRDPKVIWYEDHWVMVIAYSQEFIVGIFTSTNLITWTPTSNFSLYGLQGLQWECPNLVEMPMDNGPNMWLLAVSINPGAPLGGSIMQYFPGSFDGKQFVPVDNVARIADFGKDNYAGQFFYGLDDSHEPVMIAWASNWQYCDVVPTAGEGWRSTMSLPRQTRLHNSTRNNFQLISIPYNIDVVPNTNVFQSSAYAWQNGPLVVQPSEWPTGVLHVVITLSPIPTDGSAEGTLNFAFTSSSTQESIIGGYNLTGDTPFWIDRGGINGFEYPLFTDKFSTNALIKVDGLFQLEMIFDRTILEVFVNDGESSATTIFYPNGRIDTFSISALGLNSEIDLGINVWALEGTW